MLIDAHVVDPDESLFAGKIKVCNARSVGGEIGILPGHQPCLMLLAPSPLELFAENGERHTFVVFSGFLEFAHNSLTVLCDEAKRVESKDDAFALLADRGLTLQDADVALDGTVSHEIE